MKAIVLAAALALTAVTTSALAQTPAPAPTNSTAPASKAKLSVQTSTLAEIFADPAGKAVLEEQLPLIDQFYERYKEKTLVQAAPDSFGNIDDAKLKAIQAAFDALK